MIESGDFSISLDKINADDFVRNLDKYKWKPSFYFREGSRSASLANGYGADIDFSELYSLLGDPFLERYFDTVFPYSYIKDKADTFLSDLSQELFGDIENIGLTENDLNNEKAKNNVNINRYKNAIERNETAFNKWFTLTAELDDLWNSLPKTKGSDYTEPDRRRSSYRQYLSKKAELASFEDEMSRTEKSLKREEKRATNSDERVNNLKNELNSLKRNTDFKFSVQINQQGTELAKEVRENIISCAQSGTLPLSTQRLAKITMLKRIMCGLPAMPRFYASRQFINSIIVTFSLERTNE